MKIINQKVPDSFNVFLFGDKHEGSIASYKKGWDKMVEMINSTYEGIAPEHNYAIDHGDQVEAIMVDDKRYDPKVCTQAVPMEQLDNVLTDYQAIKSHLVVVLDGNHPWKLHRFGFMVEHLAEKLGVPYGTFTSKVIWRTEENRIIFKSYHAHGGKSISSTADDPVRAEANMKLILKRHLKNKAGDALLMAKGHAHKLLILEPTKSLYMVDDGKKILQRYTSSNQAGEWIHPDHKFYVCTGSFLRLYAKDASTYSEKYEYDPTELGFAICKVRDRQIQGIDKVIL
jgi:hypothetical protein